jgi:hypothetical protein
MTTNQIILLFMLQNCIMGLGIFVYLFDIYKDNISRFFCCVK